MSSTEGDPISKEADTDLVGASVDPTFGGLPEPDWALPLRRSSVRPAEGMVVRTTHDAEDLPAGSFVRLLSEEHLLLVVERGSFGPVGPQEREQDVLHSIVPWVLDRATFLLVCDVAEDRQILFCGWEEGTRGMGLSLKDARGTFWWGKYRNEMVYGLAKALEAAHDAPPPRRRWFGG